MNFNLNTTRRKTLKATLYLTLVGSAGLTGLARAEPFTLHSPTFSTAVELSTDHVLNGYGCSGKNRSPALTWQHAPADTKSFAITLYDPDAPTGSGWWHWVVYNIPASANGLAENAGATSSPNLSNGAVQGLTDFGSPGYGGPCPPVGKPPHHYILTVHALNIEKLDLPKNASSAMIGYIINMHRIDSATIELQYGR